MNTPKCVFLLFIYLWLTPSVVTAGKPLAHKTALKQFPATLHHINTQRKAFHKKYQQARTANQRQAILAQAEAFIVDQVINNITPAWLGMPWTMAIIKDGLKPNARIPYEKGKGVSCSWFVVSLLENAGLNLGNPSGFAGTIAVHLQRSLSPEKKDFKRIFNASPRQLEKRMMKWGDGLYIIGLNCHIGFVHVQGQKVTFIHSNYTHPTQVLAEPLINSEAISLSEDTGYVVTALFKDNRLLHHWLTGQKLFFRGPRK